MSNKYVGELYSGYRLRPILFCSEEKDNEYIHRKIYLKKARITSNESARVLNIPLDSISKDIVYHNGIYTLGYEVYNFIDVFEDRDCIELGRLLSNKNNINAIESFIGLVNSKGGRFNRKLGIAKPKSMKGLKLIFNDYSNCTDIIDSNVLNKYIEILRYLRADVYCRYSFGNKIYALKRNVLTKGISYRVLEKVGSKFKRYEVYLEDIYDNHDKYANVELIKDGIVIYSLEGTYYYDINKVHDEYNRKVVKNNNAILKARALGILYDYKMLDNGELINFITDRPNVRLPKEVKIIGKRAIELHKNNKSLAIEGNIVKAHMPLFKNIRSSNLVEIFINCNEEVAIKAIRSLGRRGLYYLNRMVYSRDMTPKEVAYILIYGRLRFLESPNFDINKVNNPELKDFITRVCYHYVDIRTKLDKNKQLYKLIAEGTSLDDLDTTSRNRISNMGYDLMDILPDKGIEEINNMIVSIIHELYKGKV